MKKREKINEAKKNNKPIKLIDTNFLKNPDILKSKFIYNIFLEDFARKNHSNLLNNNDKKEEQQIFLSLNKLSSSNIRLVNYKLIYNALPTNYKFRNKYDKKCFMCKKNLNEDCEHIFITCDRSKEFFEYVRHEYLHKKKFKKLHRFTKA